MVRNCVLAAAVLVYSSLVYAQFGVLPSFADQTDAPARIVQMEGIGHELRIKNRSHETITQFQIGWVTKAQCTDKPTLATVDFGHVVRAELRPRGSVETIARENQSDQVSNDPFVDEARNLNAVVEVQFGVVYVKFADGKAWHYDLRKVGNFGSDERDASICQQVRK